MRREKENSFFKNAAIIAAGGFIAKVIGAVYRIPLTNWIGGEGIGLYQLVYPVYCLLLTVSAIGIPSSIAKLTAERIGRGEHAKPLFVSAMKLFLWIGAAGMLLMAIISPFLSRAQGSGEVLLGYYALAPSVLIVSAISVFRGYFQGQNNMAPTAVSEIIEQAVKVAFGLIFAWFFRSNVKKAVVYLLLSVSISEVVALAFMCIVYRVKSRKKIQVKLKNDGGSVETKSILRLSLPVTLCSLLIPLSSLIDSVLAVRLLRVYHENAVSLYGLFAGGAVTVINLPVSVCYGVAAASIPAVAAAKAKIEKKQMERAFESPVSVKNSVRKKWLFSFFVTVAISLPAAVGLYYFAEPIAKTIYKSLDGQEMQTLIALIRALSLSAFTLSCAQTLSACLTAQGKPQLSATAMAMGLLIKTAAYLVFLKKPENSVLGLVYATNIGYLVAFLLDLLYNFLVSKDEGAVGALTTKQQKENKQRK